MADLRLSEVDQLQTREYWVSITLLRLSFDKISNRLKHSKLQDTRYQKDRDDTTFDWFKTFQDLEPFFRKHITWDNESGRDLRIVMLGCGNSVSRVLFEETFVVWKKLITT